MIHLVIGGARSGKSSFAEQEVIKLAQKYQQNKAYIATATAGDKEMAGRILAHQKQRQAQQWQLIECPVKLAELITDLDNNGVYLLDCLTLWLTNILMLAYQRCPEGIEQETFIDNFIKQQVALLSKVLQTCSANLIIVTNEVGQGVVPLGAQSRLFVDHSGWLNQAIAKIAQQVTLVTAGLPLSLKNTLTSVEEK